MGAEEPLNVLVVDDHAEVRAALRRVLEHAGHHVEEAETGEGALERLEAEAQDVVLLDLGMPGMGGLAALERIRDQAPRTAVIVVTGEATVQSAYKAGQMGAFDFLEKPPDRERLLAVVAEAARVAHLRQAEARTAPSAADDLGILGRSAAIESLRDQVRRIGPSQGRVLITGENGAGKELAAHALHVLSKRASGPFVKMNCAAIPRELVESELFGHERGAFTGAHQARKGRVELATGGTLFLDEVGDLALDAQAKLLRAIETGEIERIGGSQIIHCDVRFIAATNKDLPAAIAAEEFREDLYYRLNVLPLHVPALRERVTDIVPLARHFLDTFSRAEARAPKTPSEEARTLLEEYSWPGNVRELRNLMERTVVLVEGETIRAEDLAPWLEGDGARADQVGLRGEIERRESEAIRRALEAASWNVTQAAAGLGIDRTNLHRKMRKYGISRR
jgi:DNA-binding NtrC family response regulator